MFAMYSPGLKFMVTVKTLFFPNENPYHRNRYSERMMVLEKYDPPQMQTGVDFIKVLHLYFTRVAIVCLTENNICTCKAPIVNYVPGGGGWFSEKCIVPPQKILR